MKWLCVVFLFIGGNLFSQTIDSVTLECDHDRILNFHEDPFKAQIYSWMISEGKLIEHWGFGLTMDFTNVSSDIVTVQVFGYDTISGCITDTATFLVKFETCGNVYIPSAFSPNGDGINDIFYIRGNVNLITFKIYNRWGENVFISRDINHGWDGSFKGVPAPIEVYVYFAIVEEEGAIKKYKGNITLIR